MSKNPARALVIVAHGSRRADSNDEIRALAERLDGDPGNAFGMVEAAYLELAEPSIPEGIERCIRKGASEVVVYPYFLSKGRHVIEDIPREVGIKQREHTGVEIRLAEYLGNAAGMSRLIFEHLHAQQ